MKSGGAVILTIIPTAPAMLVCSRSGELIACSAAKGARLSPFPCPIPINALPAPRIMDSTSAKSTLISPDSVTMSEMLFTPWRRISSPMRNASRIGNFLSIVSISRWFGTTITESAASRSSSRPSSATVERRCPSKSNGRVTTAIVSAPRSFACEAMSGAAPVPVPPPIPAVMKTMFAFSTIVCRSSLSSSAAFRPTSGLAPDPKPSVVLRPIVICVAPRQVNSACWSVLTA